MELVTYTRGRPPLPSTLRVLEDMVREIKRTPGIQSAKLAKMVGVKTLRCGVLARRLSRLGLITIELGQDGSLRYYPASE